MLSKSKLHITEVTDATGLLYVIYMGLVNWYVFGQLALSSIQFCGFLVFLLDCVIITKYRTSHHARKENQGLPAVAPEIPLPQPLPNPHTVSEFAFGSPVESHLLFDCRKQHMLWTSIYKPVCERDAFHLCGNVSGTEWTAYVGWAEMTYKNRAEVS